jgi:DNA primase
MAYPPEFLDRVRTMVPLADTVARQVRLTKRGREYTGLCPFHGEKTPSFTVSDEKGFFHCFGCGAHGDVIGFVMRAEGLSFPEAVEKLAHEAGLPLPQRGPEARERERRRAGLHEVVEAACQWFQEQLACREGRAARDYLARRGVGDEAVATFRLGFAPDRRGALRQALNGRGVTDDQLVAAGLIKQPEDGGPPRDYFFNRLIFPITDRRGRVIAFGGRALGESPAKYLNSPDTDLFHKGHVLYNLARARRAAHDGAEVIVCEGYMDVIGLWQAGFPAAVAPLGTAITVDQIQALWRLASEPVVCLDGDSAGRRAGVRLVERALPVLKPGASLRFAFLPSGEDPDSLVQAHGAPAFREVLDGARPLADMLWHSVVAGRKANTPERQAGLRKELTEAVRRIEDRAVQDAYWQAMDQRFRETFRPRRPAGRGGTAKGARGSGGRGAAGGGASAAPRGPAVARQPVRMLRRRQEQAFVAALLNHPGLINELAEDLATLSLESADLERVLRHMLDLAAQGERLDSIELGRHLRRIAEDSVVDSVTNRDIYRLWPFADPAATVQTARSGVRHFMDLYRERAAQAETRAEGQRLAASMDGEALTRLAARQRATRLVGAAGTDPLPDGDGATTGSPTAPAPGDGDPEH